MCVPPPVDKLPLAETLPSAAKAAPHSLKLRPAAERSDGGHSLKSVDVDLTIICQAQRRQPLVYNEFVWATPSYFAGNVICFGTFRIRPRPPPPRRRGALRVCMVVVWASRHQS
jgi:hypothetical protein